MFSTDISLAQAKKWNESTAEAKAPFAQMAEEDKLRYEKAKVRLVPHRTAVDQSMMYGKGQPVRNQCGLYEYRAAVRAPTVQYSRVPAVQWSG